VKIGRVTVEPGADASYIPEFVSACIPWVFRFVAAGIFGNPVMSD